MLKRTHSNLNTQTEFFTHDIVVVADDAAVDVVVLSADLPGADVAGEAVGVVRPAGLLRAHHVAADRIAALGASLKELLHARTIIKAETFIAASRNLLGLAYVSVLGAVVLAVDDVVALRAERLPALLADEALGVVVRAADHRRLLADRLPAREAIAWKRPDV